MQSSAAALLVFLAASAGAGLIRLGFGLFVDYRSGRDEIVMPLRLPAGFALALPFRTVPPHLRFPRLVVLSGLFGKDAAVRIHRIPSKRLESPGGNTALRP